MHDFIGLAIEYGAIVCALVSFIVLSIIFWRKKQTPDLSDLLVVGAAGSSLPIGCLLVWGAFDKTVLQRLIESNIAHIHIAFAGAVLICIFLKIFASKLTR